MSHDANSWERSTPLLPVHPVTGHRHLGKSLAWKRVYRYSLEGTAGLVSVAGIAASGIVAAVTAGTSAAVAASAAAGGFSAGCASGAGFSAAAVGTTAAPSAGAAGVVAAGATGASVLVAAAESPSLGFLSFLRKAAFNFSLRLESAFGGMPPIVSVVVNTSERARGWELFGKE
ncbi:hypothetical protein F5B17DRAFT_412936 [Nemania serpens]|nr:hypothetical protein F5B17DRAFT_412936 [Nemania serpens]